MKTDRFDDELRRKLLGLPPPKPDADDVERILGYVRANRPGIPGRGWGRRLLYGIAGALLLGSVLYNVNQYYTNKHLYVSLDSLRQQVAVRPGQPVPLAPATPAGATLPPRPDTVYITRYHDRLITLSPMEQRPAPLSARTGEPTVLPDGDAPVSKAKNYAPTGPSRPDSAAEYADKTAPALLVDTPDTHPNRVDDTPAIRLPIANDLALATPNRRPTRTDRNPPTQPETDSPKAGRSETGASTLAMIRSGENQRQTTRKRSKTSPHHSTRPSVADATGDPIRSSNTPTQPTTENDVAPSWLVVEPLQLRPLLLASGLTFPTNLPIASRSIATKTEPVARPARRGFHLTLPQVSVAKSSLFMGVGGTSGIGQFGGSFLGEWHINPRWSVQTGLTYAWLFREGYNDDERFGTQTQQDFRTLYAPNVPRSDEIHDITQSYQLFQLPLTVAYRYPLGRTWSLRFGVGTAFDLNAGNRVSFDYFENGLTSLQGLYQAPESVRLLNNLTITAGIERQWKGWLLRASPFISPQLRPVTYKPDNLYWGGQVQLLRRFGRK